MSGSIYLKTLRDLRGMTLVWAAGIVVLAGINVLFFPTIQKMPGVEMFLENLPAAFKAMIGDLSAVVRMEGFLHIKLFEPLPLLLAIFGISHAAQFLAGELEHKTIDLLMARPIRRWRVVVAKYLALATCLFGLCVAVAIGTVIWVRVVGSDVSAGHIVVASLKSLPLSWLFAALGLLGSSLVSHPQKAAVAAGSLVVASYVFETLAVISPALAGWSAVSLFAHHKEIYTMAGVFEPAPMLLLSGIAVVLVAGAAAVWERRDLGA